MQTPPTSIVEARARLMHKAVFFSYILYDQCKLSWVSLDETRKSYPDAEEAYWYGQPLPTACTDGYNIVVNVDFLAKMNVDQRAFVIAHEVYHAMARHAQRMRKYMVEGLFNKPFLPLLYNIAADAVINKCLVDSHIGQMPPDGVMLQPHDFKPAYTVIGLESAEEIYEKLLDGLPQGIKDALDRMGNGDAGAGEVDGQAAGNLPKPGSLGNDVVPNSPDSSASSQQNEATMKAAVASAAAQAKTQGNLPAGLKRFIDGFLEPQVSWQEKLRETIRSRSGHDISSWSKPNRRKLVSPGVYFPRRIGMRTGHIGCAIDTSGSVSEKELKQFLGEVSSILGDMRPEILTLMWCDAKVDGVEELLEPEDLQVAAMVKGAGGGGGTSFIPPFEYVVEHEIPITTMIYLTDGYGPFPSEDQAPFPTIWCISSDVVAPFGETIKITY